MKTSALLAVVEQLLKQPTPDALAKLQPLLLAWPTPEAKAVHEMAGQFYLYLSAIRNMMEARQFPLLATSLSMTSTTIGMAEELISEGRTNRLKLMVDGLRMALDTLGTYQFVRQWEPTFAAIHDGAVWRLYEAWWQLSEDSQPDLPITRRAELLDQLFEIPRNPEADSALRLAFLVRLYQWGLVARLAPMLQTLQTTQEE
jgi:hypothetical protein